MNLWVASKMLRGWLIRPSLNCRYSQVYSKKKGTKHGKCEWDREASTSKLNSASGLRLLFPHTWFWYGWRFALWNGFLEYPNLKSLMIRMEWKFILTFVLPLLLDSVLQIRKWHFHLIFTLKNINSTLSDALQVEVCIASSTGHGASSAVHQGSAYKASIGDEDIATTRGTRQVIQQLGVQVVSKAKGVKSTRQLFPTCRKKAEQQSCWLFGAFYMCIPSTPGCNTLQPKIVLYKTNHSHLEDHSKESFCGASLRHRSFPQSQNLQIQNWDPMTYFLFKGFQNQLRHHHHDILWPSMWNQITLHPWDSHPT